MRPVTLIYALLSAAGLAVSIAVPLTMSRSGSADIPLWTTVASPGPLSTAHTIFGERCEACHTPARGATAEACLTCHATAAPELLSKPSTAFHASVNECAGCHSEHRGQNRRPITMDHALLVAIGHARAATGMLGNGSRFAHYVAWIRAQLNSAGSAPKPLESGSLVSLDCAGCHTNRDVHRTLFGWECQSCHNVVAWTIAGFRHPSPLSQECAQCHQAPPSHYMMHFEMMDRMMTGQAGARVEQCYLCHQTDSFNNIKGVGWFKMH